MIPDPSTVLPTDQGSEYMKKLFELVVFIMLGIAALLILYLLYKLGSRY
jgi:hypothetical protein